MAHRFRGCQIPMVKSFLGCWSTFVPKLKSLEVFDLQRCPIPKCQVLQINTSMILAAFSSVGVKKKDALQRLSEVCQVGVHCFCNCFSYLWSLRSLALQLIGWCNGERCASSLYWEAPRRTEICWKVEVGKCAGMWQHFCLVLGASRHYLIRNSSRNVLTNRHALQPFRGPIIYCNACVQYFKKSLRNKVMG